MNVRGVWQAGQMRGKTSWIRARRAAHREGRERVVAGAFRFAFSGWGAGAAGGVGRGRLGVSAARALSYSEIFGWKKTVSMDVGEMGIYQMFGPGSEGQFSCGGMMNKPPQMTALPHWLYYVKVEDIHRAVEWVKENGGQVWTGPMEVPGEDMIAMCADPPGRGLRFARHKGTLTQVGGWA